MAGRDINATYFVSASSAVLAALVGLAILLAMWQPWQEATSDDKKKPSGTSADPHPFGDTSTHSSPTPEPSEDEGGEDDTEDEEASKEPEASASPSLTPDPPDPVDVAFESVAVGTCLNAYDTGWGQLNVNRPIPVDCGASFAFTKVTMVTTHASSCPEGGGQWGWGHTNDDGSSVALCLARVFTPGQCFPAKLAKRSDGALHGQGRLFSVWDCNQTQVPKGQNAIMIITAVVRGEDCPRRSGRQTLSWPIFNGGRTLCSVLRPS
ncbi:hypothetical protein ACWDQL_32915 [Streptomyces olivaceus]